MVYTPSVKPWGLFAACLAVGAAALPGMAQGAVVVARYEFPDGASNTSSDPDLNSNAGAFGVGGGIALFGSGRGNPPGGKFFASGDVTSTSEGTSVTANDYVEFTVTPAGGASLSFTTLDFQVQRDTANGPTNYFVRADQVPGAGGNDFATTVGSGTFSPTVGSLSAANDPSLFIPYSVTLGDDAFLQNVTTATTFRVYFFDANAATNTENIRIDNVVLNADVVPEPAAAGLILVGAAVLGRTDRGRRL